MADIRDNVIVVMSAQQPRPTSDLKLPPEVWFMVFDLLFIAYLEEATQKGRDYLPHRLVLPSAPWNVLSLVCKRARDLVRSHSAHITMLRPDLTLSALFGRQDDVPLHLHYTDIDNWEEFDGVRTSDFDILSAVELALAVLSKAKSFTAFAATAYHTDQFSSLIPRNDRGKLSEVDKANALSKILRTMATIPQPLLQDLRILAYRDREPGDPYEDIMRESENAFWGSAQRCFPDLRYLALSGLKCMVAPRLPSSLVELTLACSFNTSMDNLLDMLYLLRCLHKLSLSDYAHDLPSITPDRLIRRRYVLLPHLDKLVLQDTLSALTAILSHLDFRPTTSMELRNHRRHDAGMNAAETIHAFVCEVQSHLEPCSDEEAIPAFELLEINFWRQVYAFDLHATAGGQSLDIWLDWTFAEASFDGLRTFLKEARELHSVWRLSLSPGRYRWRAHQEYRVFEPHEALLCLSEVEELWLQGDLTRHICKALRYVYPDSTPVVFPALHKLMITDNLELDDHRLDKHLGARADVLRQLVFVSCPRLSRCSENKLSMDLGGVSVDLSQVDQETTATFECPDKEEAPGAGEWTSDSESSFTEDDDLPGEPTNGIPIPV